MKRLLVCLLLVGVMGCGKSEQAKEKPSNNALEIMTKDLNAPLQPEPEVHFQGQGSVSGLVVLEGEAPAASVFTLKEDMQELTGKETITRQPWQVSENGGLADCVVTLRNTDRKNAVQPEPLAGATMVKNGTNFIPRILVVTKGTTLDYRNENSPCNCFEVRGRGLFRSRSILVPAGRRMDLELEAVGFCRVFSNLRPYYDAWIHVVDTPYYIITAQDGRFEFPEVAAGEYRLQVWHSGVKTLKREITVLDGKKQDLNFQFTLAKAKELGHEPDDE